jgi:hypothetical protein
LRNTVSRPCDAAATSQARAKLSPRYWRPGGVARALRDLLGPDGRDWRDLGFARHLAGRLVRLRRRGRSP